MAKKILVIEDDKDIRDTIVYVLEEEGYEVIASDNARILKKVNDLEPDLILLDNWLTDWTSDLSGQQLSKALKNNPTTKHIPVILVSAINNLKEIAQAGEADGYIQKPFDLTELIEVVKRHITIDL
ncbi:response regulator [Mucilaginibacter lappiensis]|uniref:CheY-like chemotaxis protein n=1 Tax=Mucilaginibacter lappiensis TaxID=354630 RepID=A0A1N7FSM8_9SPHI|nr:response regulator [Mucilaginibacter lappiensis]MBB6112578.1 CheY-like chemotaxis protein [Mucilaginibacter lappiensis]MBB6112579.1 CheY-like chemotaxis protein [Mucilaginibacter lappiensis]MBB6129184.1 CheY-like chemotaxis protein [Mucilaginibacter lappiensis]SIS03349.1 Response regulator receiver domain-containing protein [Mucilaginibacter lappiensis]